MTILQNLFINFNPSQNPMYTHILVPIDGSPTSDRALTEAASLARLTGAQVRLLHILDPVTHTRGFERPETYSQDILPQAQQAGQALLESRREQLARQGIAVDTQLLESLGASVARLVVEHAAEWKASVIVLGTLGRRGLERMLMGSDAEQIARHATTPVLLVRQTAGAAHTPA